MNSSEAAVAVIDALDAAGVPYALVGSFSSNLFGIPRSTEDVDLVIDLRGRTLSEVLRSLGPEFSRHSQRMFETVTGTTFDALTVTGTPLRIELFRLSDDPHDQERFRRRRTWDYLGRRVWMPTAEDVVITKLRWFHLAGRQKDYDDARDVVAVQAGNLDWSYMESWCDRHETRPWLQRVRGFAKSERP